MLTLFIGRNFSALCSCLIDSQMGDSFNHVHLATERCTQICPTINILQGGIEYPTNLVSNQDFLPRNITHCENTEVLSPQKSVFYAGFSNLLKPVNSVQELQSGQLTSGAKCLSWLYFWQSLYGHVFREDREQALHMISEKLTNTWLAKSTKYLHANFQSQQNKFQPTKRNILCSRIT